MPIKTSIQSAIIENVSAHFPGINDVEFIPVGGGSINNCYRIRAGEKKLFCKLNSATKFPQLFTREKDGLALIEAQEIIKVPSVINCFEYDDQQVLLMDWINEGERTETFWKKFGEQLAHLHHLSAYCFGLTGNNYMGSVPQSNRFHQSWISFFMDERLQPMVEKCYQKQLLTATNVQQFESLYKKLDSIFTPEKPSLLHGDLWSGNFMCNQSGEPVLIDPAVYYGHRSIDLAMTTLFGGFRQPFYEAYHYHFPFPANYKEQWAVCNLYPLLIHLDLFGTSYVSQIQYTLREIC